jgi:hypothetical protein
VTLREETIVFTHVSFRACININCIIVIIIIIIIVIIIIIFILSIIDSVLSVHVDELESSHIAL